MFSPLAALFDDQSKMIRFPMDVTALRHRWSYTRPAALLQDRGCERPRPRRRRTQGGPSQSTPPSQNSAKWTQNFEKENPPEALVRGLSEECEKLTKGLVISCDANAYHTQWGCPNNSDRGESLFDFILNSNLFLCNRGIVPTFITETCQTIIDLTLVSDALVGAVKNWVVSDKHSF